MKCCIRTCKSGKTVPSSGEDYYMQHCIPDWLYRHAKAKGHDDWSNYEEAKWGGMWCEDCETHFTKMDTKGARTFKGGNNGRPGILKRMSVSSTSKKYRLLEKGKPLLVKYQNGDAVWKYLRMEIKRHYQQPNRTAKNIPSQTEAKRFVLSVLERMQYHPEISKANFYQLAKSLKVDFSIESDFDVMISRYTSKEKDSGMWKLTEPKISWTNSIDNTDSNVEIIGGKKTIKVIWQFSGFLFRVFYNKDLSPENREYHNDWFAGETTSFKIAKLDYESFIKRIGFTVEDL